MLGKSLVSIVTALALSAIVGAAGGCVHGHSHYGHPMAQLAHAALVTAAIVGQVLILEHHDAHFHDQYCGHHRRYHDGRWVYHYDGHWEYYDHHHERWYYYAD